MDKIAHHAELKVFVKPGEDAQKISLALVSLVPFDLEKEKLSVGEISVEGFDKKIIKILNIKLEKQRHVKKFLDFLLEKLLDDQKKTLVEQIPSRLDDECNYFIRFDKQEFLKGVLKFTDSGECFHLRILIAAFPAKKELAVEVVKKWLVGE